MLQRFVAASAVASITIAVSAAGLLLIPVPNPYLLVTLWCFVPLVWGLWAVCAPSSWVPARFPRWGAILGFVAAVLAIAINLPMRVGHMALTLGMTIVCVVVAMILYYMLWMLVGAVYRSLTSEGAKAQTAKAA